MAAENDTRLLSKAIRERNITPLLDRGVVDSWFVADDDRIVWQFIRNHWTKYGEVPTAVTVKDNYPNYTLLRVEDSLEFLLDELIAYRRQQAAVSIVKTAVNFISDSNDYEAALAAMSNGLNRMEESGISDIQDLDLTDKALDRWEVYQDRKNLPDGLIGIPTGFPTIDRATSGLQNGQLVTIIAPPKCGKSSLALQIGQNIHKLDYTPYFRSFEMSNAEQLARYDAMRANISHTRLMTGTLHSDEEDRYLKTLRKINRTETKFWLGDSAVASTVGAISAKIQYHQPNIVFIDGVYLMIDEQSGDANTPQALTNITRSLKRMAQRFDIPVVITTQTLLWKMKKNNVTADSIGYASSFFQDSDVILGLQRPNEEEGVVSDTRQLKVVASRNCPNVEVTLVWDWETADFREMVIG